MMTQVFTGPPTITTHPTSQLTNVSMSVTLDCEGIGEGMITYNWENNKTNRGQWINISNSKILVVRNLEQSQQYRCVVSNEAGSTRSDVATVIVLRKLFKSHWCELLLYRMFWITEIIIHPASSINAIESEDITLTCLASVNDVTYSWHHIVGNISSQSLGKDSDILVIPKVTSHDAGLYYCMAIKEGIVVVSNKSMVIVNSKG